MDCRTCKIHTISTMFNNYLQYYALIHKLKSELLEEPLVVASLVLLLENLANSLLGVLTLRGLIESLLRDRGLEAIVVEVVTGRHNVAVVHTLNERLDLSAAGNLLFGVLASDLLGVSLDANNESVTVRVSLGSLVERLDDNDLLTGLTTPSNDGDLVGLQKLSHDLLLCCL